MSDLIIDLPDPTARLSARIGLGRAGARPRTRAQRVFDADHAITQDALAETIPPELLEELGLFSVDSAAPDRETYLLRPDLGRRLSESAIETLRAQIPPGADVQIVVSEGLSARAVTVNLPELLPALRITLAEAGLRVGPPFCVRLGRVGLLNAVNAVADARVVVLLVGERPGLGRADALSAYLGFRPQVDSTDADREVICNIFPSGLPAREAARRIAGQIFEILRAGASCVRRGARS